MKGECSSQRHSSGESQHINDHHSESNSLFLAKRRFSYQQLQSHLQSQFNSISVSHITSLDLSRNKLTDLPPELSLLTNLRHLNLSSNQFTYIPNVVFTFTSLQSLLLYQNNLQNSIPDELGHSLPNLVVLKLYANSLSGSIPNSFSNLRKLEVLHLGNQVYGGNSLSAIPTSVFSQLVSLKELDLSCNEISTLPCDIFFPGSKLEYLNLSENKLDTVPSSIGYAVELRSLHLSNNLICKLPVEIAGLCKLEICDLSGNLLCFVPEELVKRITKNHEPPCTSSSSLSTTGLLESLETATTSYRHRLNSAISNSQSTYSLSSSASSSSFSVSRSHSSSNVTFLLTGNPFNKSTSSHSLSSINSTLSQNSFSALSNDIEDIGSIRSRRLETTDNMRSSFTRKRSGSRKSKRPWIQVSGIEYECDGNWDGPGEFKTKTSISSSSVELHYRTADNVLNNQSTSLLISERPALQQSSSLANPILSATTSSTHMTSTSDNHIDTQFSSSSVTSPHPKPKDTIHLSPSRRTTSIHLPIPTLVELTARTIIAYNLSYDMNTVTPNMWRYLESGRPKGPSPQDQHIFHESKQFVAAATLEEKTIDFSVEESVKGKNHFEGLSSHYHSNSNATNQSLPSTRPRSTSKTWTISTPPIDFIPLSVSNASSLSSPPSCPSNASSPSSSSSSSSVTFNPCAHCQGPFLHQFISTIEVTNIKGYVNVPVGKRYCSGLCLKKSIGVENDQGKDSSEYELHTNSKENVWIVNPNDEVFDNFMNSDLGDKGTENEDKMGSRYGSSSSVASLTKASWGNICSSMSSFGSGVVGASVLDW
ncbi:hypothetical protein BKA69DRAFT_1042262 [Paraphysoderma sedebokerense]|nr:hypothetical protein BKA69DRAFT_1042262 [Paraphysoderma sedebokerense]